jgi:hypothetical protein
LANPDAIERQAPTNTDGVPDLPPNDDARAARVVKLAGDSDGWGTGTNEVGQLRGPW